MKDKRDFLKTMKTVIHCIVFCPDKCHVCVSMSMYMYNHANIYFDHPITYIFRQTICLFDHQMTMCMTMTADHRVSCSFVGPLIL